MASKKESGIKPYRSDIKKSYHDLHRTKTMKAAEDEAIFRHSDNLKPYQSGGDYATMENDWPPDPPGPGPWPPWPPNPYPDPDPPKPVPPDPGDEYFRCQGTLCYCPGKTMCEGFYCTKPVKSVTLDRIDDERKFTFSKSDGSICITAGANESGLVHYTVKMEASRVVKGKTITVVGTYEGTADECPDVLCGPTCTCGGESIGYTTQQMNCGASQNLTIIGSQPGCTYTWSVAGGGSITSGGVYTAPASNASCASNATITLSCGGAPVATLAIAANCDTGSGNATWTFTFVSCDPDNYVVNCYAFVNTYRCDGTQVAGSQTINCSYVSQVGCYPVFCTCQNCKDGPNFGGCGTSGSFTANLAISPTDLRTAGQLAAGCCPAIWM